MSDEKLLPCPFCGVEWVSTHRPINGAQPYIVCKGCNASGPYTAGMSEPDWRTAWNARAGQAAAQAKAEERVAGLEAENARLRQHIADEANRINIAGSAYESAQLALDQIVTGLKMRARETLAVRP